MKIGETDERASDQRMQQERDREVFAGASGFFLFGFELSRDGALQCCYGKRRITSR
jgi:hypothetical protein